MTDMPPRQPYTGYPPGWQQPNPYGPHITVMTTPPPPRQSCAVHAILLLTTAGIGNLVYALWHWHTHRYAR